MAFGIRNTIRLSLRYPEFLIMPIFSFWTFGPCQAQDQICISYQLTWMNASISTMAWFITLLFEEISPNYYFILFILINIDMIVLYYIQYNLETRNDNEAIYVTVLNVNTMKEGEEEDTNSELKFKKKNIFKNTKSNFLTFSKVQKHIFCFFKNGKKSIFAIFCFFKIGKKSIFAHKKV